jgi:hydroxyacylglutathione hydrolase
VTLTFHQFLCRSDNYAVLMKDEATGKVALVDAPEKSAVFNAIDETGWKPDYILVTHYHPDHVAAIDAVKSAYGSYVVGPQAEAEGISGLDKGVEEGDEIFVGETRFEVLETPGHTAGHVVYYSAEAAVLFAGDTLFALGCGRLFEGSPEDMWHSLTVLRGLPDDTMVYCGHEYTQSNAKFALSVDGANNALKGYAEEVETLRAAGKATVPFRLGREKEANPFLRADVPELRKALDMEEASNVDVFAKLRSLKDSF